MMAEKRVFPPDQVRSDTGVNAKAWHCRRASPRGRETKVFNVRLKTNKGNPWIKLITRSSATVVLRYLSQQKLQCLPSSTFPYHVDLVYYEARELVQLLRALRRRGRSCSGVVGPARKT